MVYFPGSEIGLSHGLNSSPSTYRPVNQLLITLMCEMNQNIIHSTDNIGSTLLNNNAASDVSEWFLEWFWSCELFCLCLLFIVLISFIRWCNIISLQSKFSPGPKKKYPHREKTTPFPTRPVFLTPDRTDPRFKQNMAPWPESGRGCTVRSEYPRRSGVPRSSLLYIELAISMAGDLNHLSPHADFSYGILFFYSLIWFTNVHK